MPDQPAAPDRAPKFTPARFSTLWAGLSVNVRGATFVAGGAFLLIVMASLVKHLGQSLPVFEVLFLRFLAGLIVILPLFFRIGFASLRTHRLKMHMARGFVGTMGNICFFYTLIHLAIADSVTLQFSRPMIMILIAMAFLGEPFRLNRGLATLLGFAGILMITRPFGDGFQPWALVGVAGAFFGTLVVLTVKLLSRTEQTMTIMFYFAVWTTVMSAVPAAIYWQAPTPTEWGLLVLTGAIGIVGQSMFTHGIGLGETTFVLPFDYLRIVYSVVIGVIAFAELPGLWSWAGMLVIIGASLYLLRTDAAARARAAQAAAGEKPRR